jgi:hypothetical protein
VYLEPSPDVYSEQSTSHHAVTVLVFLYLRTSPAHNSRRAAFSIIDLERTAMVLSVTLKVVFATVLTEPDLIILAVFFCQLEVLLLNVIKVNRTLGIHYLRQTSYFVVNAFAIQTLCSIDGQVNRRDTRYQVLACRCDMTL